MTGPWPSDWHQQVTNVEEVELAYPAGQGRPALGHVNGQWEQMKLALKDGGELWHFSSPAKDWQHLAGREGVALVRNGEIVQSIVMRMN